MSRRAPPGLARALALFLLVWEPLTFAATAAAALNRLMLYGPPAFLLLGYRLLVVGIGMAAGRALWAGDPRGPSLARGWAIAHAVALVVTFATPFFPSNRVPGTKSATLALLVLFDAACWTWLRWSPRVRAAYEPPDEHDRLDTRIVAAGPPAGGTSDAPEHER
jgi:hypothetical protein